MGFVTRDELDAHLTPMREDVQEIKQDVKALLQSRYDNSFFGGRGQTFMLALVPAVIAAIVAALFTFL